MQINMLTQEVLADFTKLKMRKYVILFQMKSLGLNCLQVYIYLILSMYVDHFSLVIWSSSQDKKSVDTPDLKSGAKSLEKAAT